jgi:hypothetical protein
VSYSVNISGHAASEADERELADKLSQIAADSKYGAGSAVFTGSYVRGDLRTREGWIKKDES